MENPLLFVINNFSTLAGLLIISVIEKMQKTKIARIKPIHIFFSLTEYARVISIKAPAKTLLDWYEKSARSKKIEKMIAWFFCRLFINFIRNKRLRDIKKAAKHASWAWRLTRCSPKEVLIKKAASIPIFLFLKSSTPRKYTTIGKINDNTLLSILVDASVNPIPLTNGADR